MRIPRRCSKVYRLMLSLVFVYAWAGLGSGDPTSIGRAWSGDEVAPATTLKPQAVYKETTFEFGKVMEGEPIKHDFIIENRGEAPLEIHRVRPD